MMRFMRPGMGALLVAWLTVLPAGQASGQSIYKIEEDWEMVINQPDPANISPQVTFYTYPTVEAEGDYFQVQMNYEADSEFSAGGFHVAAVKNNAIVDEARSDTRRVLATDQDTIQWTSVMAVIDNKALFAIKDGHGDEWGNFGGPEYLVRIVPTPVSDLSYYHPQKSLDTVDVGFGRNRVSSITLREVRLYYTSGQVTTLAVNQQP